MQCANIPAHLNRNGIRGLPDVLFPTEGEKSAGNETRGAGSGGNLIRTQIVGSGDWARDMARMKRSNVLY